MIIPVEKDFRNLNGNSTVDALYQAKDLTDDIDSFVNRSHGGRKACKNSTENEFYKICRYV